VNRTLVAIAAAAAAVLLAGPSAAQVVGGWAYEKAVGVNFAYFTGDQQELSVRCKGKDVEVVYYIDPAVLDPALRKLSGVEFAVNVDDSDEIEWTDSHLIVESDVVYVGVGGQVAADLAHEIATANKIVVVSILTGPPSPNSMHYNRAGFPIHGAADAIKAAYAGCGIPF
jgi:hypothetical protein